MDTKQFKQLLLPLQPRMQRLAERLVGNPDEAADVVQDCFVALWNRRETLDEVEEVAAYSLRMVRNRSIDLLRRRRPTVELDMVDDDLIDEEAERDEEARYQKALALLGQLPAMQQNVVRLRHFDGMEPSAIAHHLQTTPGNVYTTLSRAYQNLKKLLSHEED